MADTPAMPPERIQPKLQGAAANEELVEKLDGLLKRYLTLLDQYTRAREQLSGELSAGYIALAKANFNAPNRARYGRDFFDERMQALRTVTIEEKEDGKFRTSIALPAGSEAKSNSQIADEPVPKSDKSSDPESNYPTPPPDSPHEHAETQGPVSSSPPTDAPASPNDSPASATKAPEGPEDQEQGARKKEQRQRDPLRWFGILVPQALRSAQGSWVAAVEGSVPRTLNLAAEMRELEIEIGRARKAIKRSGR